MYYDMQTDRLYDNEYAMEGIFGNMVKEIKDGIKSDIRETKDAVAIITGKKRREEEVERLRKIKEHEEHLKERERKEKEKRDKNSDKYELIKKKYNCYTQKKFISIITKFIEAQFIKLRADKKLMEKMRTFCESNGGIKYMPTFKKCTYYDEDFIGVFDTNNVSFQIEFNYVLDDLIDKIDKEYNDLMEAMGYETERAWRGAIYFIF